MATWNKIKTKQDYKAALHRVDSLIDAKHTEATHNELMLLSFLIEEYEATQYPIKGASPLEILRFMMEMKGIKQKELIPIMGSKSQVSKIMNGTAHIRLEMIGPLSRLMGIPKDALIADTDPDIKHKEKDIPLITSKKKTGILRCPFYKDHDLS